MYPLSPERILQLEQGFLASQALMAAIELGVFSELGKGPRSARQLRAALSLSERAMFDLPDTLVALGLLEREGDDPQAVYINTRESGHFLDRGSPGYIGTELLRAHERAQALWGRLGEASRTGQAQRGPWPPHPDAGFAILWDAPRPLAQALGEHLDFSLYRELVHLGGGQAGLSLELAARHGHLRCTSLDQPGPTEAARRRIESSGLAGRVAAQELGELDNGPLPPADVFVTGLLHACTLAQKRALVAKVWAALPPAGCFIVVEHLIDDRRRHGAAGLLGSLNMLVELGDAFGFSAADLDGWCREAGFTRIEALPLGGAPGAGASAVLAFK